MVIELEDMTGSCECMVFERGIKVLEEAGMELIPNMPVFVEAIASKREETELPRLNIERIMSLDQALERYSKQWIIYLKESQCDGALLQELNKLCQAFSGEVPLVLSVRCDEPAVDVFIESRRVAVRLTLELLRAVKALLGEKCFRIKGNDLLPKARARNWTPREDQSQGANKAG